MPDVSIVTKLDSTGYDAKLALLRELKETIERLEHEQSPDFQGERRGKPHPAFPPQLPQAQLVTVPCDGLCLSHACIAGYDAQQWHAEHGEKGCCVANRSQEQAEEQQAKCLRAHVVQLMQEYARFDLMRQNYQERATQIALGTFPEDYDLPFYAACLNGCIEFVPLGYEDHQKSIVIGAGPLRLSVGSVQEKGDDGASAGHFVLLQSWMPLGKICRGESHFHLECEHPPVWMR